VKTIQILAIALAVTACGHYQMIGVESDPSGAQIYLDGTPVAKTPATLQVGRDRAHTIYLKREGYKPELVVIDRHTATDGIDYLTPADVTKRLNPGPSSDPEMERRLKIEVEKR
jgi:PEGA domain